jgi:hypothetical protein
MAGINPVLLLDPFIGIPYREKTIGFVMAQWLASKQAFKERESAHGQAK